MLENRELNLAEKYYNEAPPTVQTELLADYAESIIKTNKGWEMFFRYVYKTNKEIVEDN